MDEFDIERAIERDQAVIAKGVSAVLSAGKGEEGSDFCIDCSDEIPEPRRLAVPHANRCVGCQEAAERH